MSDHDPHALAATIERAITELVQQAPALDPALAGELVTHLRAHGAPLALAIAGVVEQLGPPPAIDPGLALPALAMACATLAAATRGALSDLSLAAAQHEVEALLPARAAARPPAPAAPDVPAASLVRRPRP